MKITHNEEWRFDSTYSWLFYCP